MFKQFLFSEDGQTATEYMLIISVVVIAVVGAAYAFVPAFQQGVAQLGADVADILDNGCGSNELQTHGNIGCGGGGGGS